MTQQAYGLKMSRNHPAKFAWENYKTTLDHTKTLLLYVTLISWNRTNSVFHWKLSAADSSHLLAFLRFQQLVQGCTIFYLKIYFLPFVSSSSGFVNPIMLLLSCNLRCRWLFYINLLDILPFYFRRWHSLLVVRTWDWFYSLYFRIGYCFHILTSLPSQNTIRFTFRMINLPHRVIIMPSARSVFQSFH